MLRLRPARIAPLGGLAVALALSGGLLGGSGCDRAAEPTAATAAATSAGSAAPSAPPSAPATRAVRPAPPPIDAAAWARLFPDEGGPALPAPLAGVRLDAPRAEVLAAVPALAAQAAAEAAEVGPPDAAIPDKAAPDAGPEGEAEPGLAAPTARAPQTRKPDLLPWGEHKLSLYWHADSERLRYVAVDLPADAQAGLTARWGAPVEGSVGHRRRATWWIAPQRQLQAVLEGSEDRARLSFWPLAPWQSLLGGNDRQRLGFERPERPLLGATVAEVEASYAAYNPRRLAPDRIDLYLPPHEYTDRATVVRLGIAEDKVAKIEIKLSYRAHLPLRDAFRQGLTAKYGEPKEGVYGEKPRVEVDDAPGTGRITVRITP